MHYLICWFFIAMFPLYLHAEEDYYPLISRSTATQEVQGFGDLPVVKLSPKVRRELLPKTPQQVIPVHLLQPFLTRTMVLQQEQLANGPRVVGFVGERVMGSSGDEIYASAKDYLADQGPLDDLMNLENQIDMEEMKAAGQMLHKFEVVRPGKPYIDPDSGEVLGYEAIHIGTAELVHPGEPARLLLAANSKGVQINDRLLPSSEEDSVENFIPIPAPSMLKGKILRMLDGAGAVIMENSIVAINLGAIDNIKPGYLFKIVQPSIAPRFARKTNLPLKLPNRIIGTMMVFRIFERVSYALVIKSKAVAHPKNIIRGFGT